MSLHRGSRFAMAIFTAWLQAISAAFGRPAENARRSLAPQETAAAFNREIEKQLAERDFASLSVGIVRGDGLVYARSFSVADRARGEPATLRFRFAGGKTVRAEMSVDASDPPKIIYLLFPEN